MTMTLPPPLPWKQTKDAPDDVSVSVIEGEDGAYEFAIRRDGIWYDDDSREELDEQPEFYLPLTHFLALPDGDGEPPRGEPYIYQEVLDAVAKSAAGWARSVGFYGTEGQDGTDDAIGKHAEVLEAFARFHVLYVEASGKKEHLG